VHGSRWLDGVQRSPRQFIRISTQVVCGHRPIPPVS
jgi:hypothetical protein